MARLSSRKLSMNRTPIALILVVLSVMSFVLLFSGCAQEYRLSTSVVPSGGGTISPSGGLFKGTVTLVASPSKYYTFKGWAGAASGNTNPLTVKMNSDKQIVAEFEKKTFNLSVETVPSGGGTVQPKTGTFEAGTQVKVTATPSAGYRFDRWGGSITGTANQANILIDSDKTVIASFVKQYRLSLAGEPIEAGGVPDVAGLHDEGTKIALNATPNFPYYPKTWVGADTDINPTTVTMNADKSVTVIFEPTIEGEPQNIFGSLSSGQVKTNPTDSIPIELKQYEWVQGEIILDVNPPISTVIKDPNGKVIKNFGSVKQANFSFMAEFAGRYTITFTTTSIFWSNYNLTYTIYHLP